MQRKKIKDTAINVQTNNGKLEDIIEMLEVLYVGYMDMKNNLIYRRN